MGIPSSPARRHYRKNDEGQRSEREQNVRNQHPKIKIPDRSGRGELGRSLAHVEMIYDVTCEEERG